ncbi:multiple sugar transport system substrate-binding protein [Hamadaea flava]|uniref:ABC transporter substrate-binding protein n=1 Tax=Hamadaea flava TaxID=1742688 RepID=A0ABV8LR86_9ACTN|nr:sugar ABC transporter substrate-binding protein [Hamadaea flava]MCP2328709.1 multiple sugar transport system substrate-binding protein [Hamadaea flava]
MKRLRWMSGVLAAGLALAAAGCGGGDKAEDDNGPVSLRMTVWTANKDQLALFDQIAADYKSTHPNVTVKFDALPFDSYTTALTTQVAGGNPPDLAWIFEKDAPDFVSSGALTDLTPTLKGTAGYDYDDLAPATTKLWTAGDKLYGYPFSTSPFVVFYNADMLTKAGAQTPDQLVAANQWTWTAAEQAAAKVPAAEPGKFGLVIRDFDYKVWDNLASLWAGYGAAPWSADGKTCQFTSQPMIDAMTFLHNAVYTDKAMPPPGTAADFFAGDSAMTVTQISRAATLKDAKFKWGVAPLPAGPAGAQQLFGQAGIGAFGKGKHPQAAADFLAFFSNPANSAKLAQYFPPPRTSLLNAASLKAANPLLTAEQLDSVVVNGIKNGAVKASHLGYAKIDEAVRAAMDTYYQPGADVPAALAGVCKAVEPLLSTGS